MASDDSGANEAERSLQQLVASAIKHSALRVHFSLSGPVTKSVFSFDGKESSVVEVKTPPQKLARELLLRTQLLDRFRHPVEGFIQRGTARVEFKSVSVDCSVNFSRLQSEKSDAPQIALEQFLVDTPENPTFWLSLPRDNAVRIRELLSMPRGVVFVVSPSHNSRNLALRAIRDAHSDAEVIPIVEALSEDLGAFSRAEHRLVVIGLNQSDALAAVKMLQVFSPARKKQMLGIINFQQFPRNCLFCSKRSTVPTLAAPFRGYRIESTLEGCGCEVCANQGQLGLSGVASTLDLRGPAGNTFTNDASYSEIVDALQDEGFRILYEEGIAQFSSGHIHPSEFVRLAPQPPADFKPRAPQEREKGEKRQLVHLNAVVATDEVEQLPGLDFFVGGSDVAAEKPLVDREALSGRRDERQPGLREPAAADSETPPAPLVSQSASNGKTVLIIDDDPDQRSILSRVFELAGFQSETAADGIDGIVSATRLRPNLIVVDFMMPDMDGRETVRRLRGVHETNAIPILALTAYPDSEVEYQLLDAGADDFCAKSVSKKVLLKRVERLLTRKVGKSD